MNRNQKVAIGLLASSVVWLTAGVFSFVAVIMDNYNNVRQYTVLIDQQTQNEECVSLYSGLTIVTFANGICESSTGLTSLFIAYVLFWCENIDTWSSKIFYRVTMLVWLCLEVFVFLFTLTFLIAPLEYPASLCSTIISNKSAVFTSLFISAVVTVLGWLFSLVCFAIVVERPSTASDASQTKRSRPLSKKTLRRNSRTFSYKETKIKIGDSLTCSICLGKYEEGDKLRMFRCKHSFHAECVDEYVQQYTGNCPMCRQRIVSRKT